jgi:hypothetical protein
LAIAHRFHEIDLLRSELLFGKLVVLKKSIHRTSKDWREATVRLCDGPLGANALRSDSTQLGNQRGPEMPAADVVLHRSTTSPPNKPRAKPTSNSSQFVPPPAMDAKLSFVRSNVVHDLRADLARTVRKHGP